VAPGPRKGTTKGYNRLVYKFLHTRDGVRILRLRVRGRKNWGQLRQSGPDQGKGGRLERPLFRSEYPFRRILKEQNTYRGGEVKGRNH